jgi:F-type H+-transporting ATPase subunit gamma
MNSTNELKNELATVSTIQEITSVYQGIASLRMTQIKDSVAKTKEFIDGLADIYEHAREAYIAQIQVKLKERKGKNKLNLTSIRRNGKTVTVFLSANEHLYGSLILEIWRKFLADIKSNPSDILIVGKFGRNLYSSENLNYKLTYFDLADDKPSREEVQKIINFVSEYERIIVHYGQMRTLLTQEPVRNEITGRVVLEKNIPTTKRYIFEPSPEKIIEFFEKEIIAAVFNQKIMEHQLARFSSRMVAMDQASQNAGTLIKELKTQLSHAKKRLDNINQLEVFSAFNLWGEKK